MPLRRKGGELRKGHTDKMRVLKNDMAEMVRLDGDTVTFTWLETTGGTYNETYDVWEGGTKETKALAIQGVGRTVDYVDDAMEYEYGRIEVGECIVRFPHDTDLSQFKDKVELRFYFKGRKWRIDGSLDWIETINDEIFSKVIKGVRSID